jgi:ABC-type multidrug transport system ATPase subunit
LLIEIDRVTKIYRGGVRALEDVSLTLDSGMVGLLGANGAGKTTLIRILSTVVRPTHGAVRVAGLDLSTARGRSAVRRVLGYLPQYLDLYPDLTGREFLDYVGLLKGLTERAPRQRQVGELLEQMSLTADADRKVAGYSGGMRRRLGIAQALLGDPRLIVVDEPTAGLDPEERMRFRALLSSLGVGRTVLLSTHILDDVAQTCPQVAVLKSGRVVYTGSTKGLVEAARGRTYLLRTAAPVHVADGVVVNAQATDAGMEYRVVTDRPGPGADPVEPTLEDGYVALLHFGQSSPANH